MTPHIEAADILAPERAKYSELWGSVEAYRNTSPGEQNVERFIGVFGDVGLSGKSLVDLGCGAGGAGRRFRDEHGMHVTWLDLTAAGLHEDIDREHFIQAPLWKLPYAFEGFWDYGFCCDVLEHVEPEFTMLSLHHMFQSCDTVWLSISLVPDNFGQLVGAPLHLTTRSYAWWRDRIAALGTLVEARDLLSSGLYIVERPR